MKAVHLLNAALWFANALVWLVAANSLPMAALSALVTAASLVLLLREG